MKQKDMIMLAVTALIAYFFYRKNQSVTKPAVYQNDLLDKVESDIYSTVDDYQSVRF